MSITSRASRGLLLELDPDLGSRLSDDDLQQARPLCVANVVHAAPGRWQLPAAPDDGRDIVFALVLLDGVLSRQTVLGHHDVLELLCPGDIVLLPEAPTDHDLSLVATHVKMTALSDLRLMVLGAAFLRCADRWPGLLAGVHQRAAAQQHRLASQSLALHLPRAEQRILLTLWLLAERCGRMTADGLALPLAFSHETLSRLTGARRPTVSLALASLRASGCVIVRADGRMVLTSEAEREILASTATGEDAPRAGLKLAPLRRVA